MGHVKFKKESGEWQLFSDFWQLCQKFWVPEEDAAYWEQASGAAEEFYQKYKGVNEPFAKEISCALIRSLAKRVKQTEEQKGF